MFHPWPIPKPRAGARILSRRRRLCASLLEEQGGCNPDANVLKLLHLEEQQHRKNWLGHSQLCL